MHPPREDQRCCGTGSELVVGREGELARLAALLDLTKQGRGVVVNLSGQSGIGKSTVLRTFRRRLARTDPDVVMLIGRCHENESVPFKALDDLVDRLSQYLKALRSTEAEVLAPRDTPSLVRMFPRARASGGHPTGGSRVSTSFDAEELRHRAFGSLQDLLASPRRAEDPVLAIDDLQWGDLDSLAIVSALAPANPCPAFQERLCGSSSPVGGDHEQAGRRRCPEQRAQERQAVQITPLQVVDSRGRGSSARRGERAGPERLPRRGAAIPPHQRRRDS